MALTVHTAGTAGIAKAENRPRPIIRPIDQGDLETAARAAFAAHSALAVRNGHPSEHPDLSFSKGLISAKLKDPNADGLVAETEGSILGSVFLNTFNSTPVAAIGPMTVKPEAEGTGAGRLLLERAMEAAHARGITQIRLVQSPAHPRSLALYTKAGFDVREPLLLVQGGKPAPVIERDVRKATPADIPHCERLCQQVHGFVRSSEIHAAVEQGTATVALTNALITGYSTGIGFRGHSLGETSEDLKALIAASPAVTGPGFFVPVRNAPLLRWLFANGYRGIWPATLMSHGTYREPAGAFLPSIAY
jgi:predicted N-acetyltransferase YhbS